MNQHIAHCVNLVLFLVPLGGATSAGDIPAAVPEQRGFFLRQCRVVVDNKPELIVRAYWGWMTEDQMLFVLIPDGFGLAWVRVNARFRDTDITGPAGYTTSLGPSQVMLVNCADAQALHAVLDDMGFAGNDDDNWVQVRIRVLSRKKRPVLPKLHFRRKV